MNDRNTKHVKHDGKYIFYANSNKNLKRLKLTKKIKHEFIWDTTSWVTTSLHTLHSKQQYIKYNIDCHLIATKVIIVIFESMQQVMENLKDLLEKPSSDKVEKILL